MIFSLVGQRRLTDHVLIVAKSGRCASSVAVGHARGAPTVGTEATPTGWSSRFER